VALIFVVLIGLMWAGIVYANRAAGRPAPKAAK